MIIHEIVRCNDCGFHKVNGEDCNMCSLMAEDDSHE